MCPCQWLTDENDEDIQYTSTEYDLLLDMMNFSLHTEDTHQGQNYSIQIVEYQPFWEFWVPGKRQSVCRVDYYL